MEDTTILDIGKTEYSTTDLLMDSFIVASGSTEAQALFARAYIVSNPRYKKPWETYTNSFRRIFENLSDIESQLVLKQMGLEHQSNQVAVDGAVAEFRNNRGDPKKKTLLENLPSELDESNVETKLKSRNLANEVIDKSLVIVWNSSVGKERVKKLKDMSAYLGLYSQTIWWRKLDDEVRQEMKDRGKELCESGLLHEK